MRLLGLKGMRVATTCDTMQSALRRIRICLEMKMRKRNIRLKSFIIYSVIISALMIAQSPAGTVAYWRFEEGPAGTNVQHLAGENGVYSADVEDVSGSGNDLAVWSTGGFAGYAYRAEVAEVTVSLTGQTNTLSVRNTGGNPGMWCATAAMQTMSPAAFTIEATVKLENGGYRTIIGRDSRGTATTNASLAALYFQALPNNALAVKFCDVGGYWHEASSVSGIFQSFDYAANSQGAGVPWYSMAAVSDGATLSLYLLEHGADTGYQLIARTDLTAGGSPNTALTAGAGDGGDWDAGNWSVGRGLYNGLHTDRAWGFIDEVRISDSALNPSEFLFYEYIPEMAGVVVTPPDLILQEAGATAGDLFFSLEYEPAATVTLTLAEQYARGQVTLDRDTLVFTAADWDVPQAVRVTAVDDAELENAEQQIVLTVTPASADIHYDSLQVEPVVVTILENECGAWGYAVSDFTLDCTIDIRDLVQFAVGWLNCSFPDGIGCSDYSGM